jgi:ATP-dependent helicase/nuclease subunit B
LLELPLALLDHLNHGGTLLVPSAQRAAALRLAHTAAQLRLGRGVWDSPDVLPWSAWLERGLDEARARGVPVPRRLSGTESWWLWREAVRAACSDLPVLWPDALIDSVRRAALLLEDYGLELRDASAPESAVLLRARAHFARRCHGLQALWSGSWSACEPYLQPSTPTQLAGFGELGPARRKWLQRIGVVIETAGAAVPAGTLQVLDFDSPELEAEAAAQWCAAQLQRDPAARVLLVVPTLSEQRHHWLRALEQRLDYVATLDPSDPSSASHASAVAVEGGQPLREYSLIACALQLLALSAGEADFDSLSAVLRSPFLGPQAGRERLRLDLWLREHNIEVAEPQRLLSLLEPVARELDAAAAAALASLLQGLGAGANILPPADPASPAQWGQHFARVLARCGWPGPGLSSAEQQVRVRFDELLGEFAAVSVAQQPLPQAQALQLLRQLATRTAFEPASDDVPVTLTASLENPIVRYDGIWVAGLTADAWPQSARPDPLIPWAVQQAAGMPMASPEGPLRQAEQALRHWQGASAALALSWSRSDGDAPRDPSPLLLEARGQNTAPAGASEGLPWQLEAWLAASAPPLQPWHDPYGPAWPAAEPLRGGTRLLELQALCPFRGFAELRLQARPLPEPTPGIDARLRGQMLHRALELFWRATGDSLTLHARAAEDTLALVSSCVEAALVHAQRRSPGLLEPGLLRREAERAVRLLRQLLAWELTREPFETVALEWPQAYAIAGASLQLRLDRVDKLADGSLIVIDYKSGAAEPFDALAERPTVPQLPAYAMVAGQRTAAVLALYLGRHGLKLRGIADSRGRLPGLRALPGAAADWPALLRRWQWQLGLLVEEFVRGQASVTPQPGACEICHLQAFCRIDSGSLPA